MSGNTIVNKKILIIHGYDSKEELLEQIYAIEPDIIILDVIELPPITKRKIKEAIHHLKIETMEVESYIYKPL